MLRGLDVGLREQSKMTVTFVALQIRKMGTAIYRDAKSNSMRAGVWGLPAGDAEYTAGYAKLESR